MTAVAFPKIVETFKTALVESVSDFFDGEEHQTSNLNITFPEIDMVFHQQYLKEITKPTIALIGSSISNQIEHKFENANNKQLPGVMLYADILRTLIVVVPTEGVGYSNANLVADQTWDLFYAAMVGKKKELAGKGICNIVSPVFPVENISDRNRIQRSGTFRCQVQASYSRFNTADVNKKRVRLWPGPSSQIFSLKLGFQSQ